MDPLVQAAIVTAVPATIAAIASIRTNRQIRTNHGKNIGQYVEDLSAWAEHHTLQDAEHFAEIREALGLPPKPYVTREVERDT
jgi:hypothetical protein